MFIIVNILHNFIIIAALVAIVGINDGIFDGVFDANIVGFIVDVPDVGILDGIEIVIELGISSIVIKHRVVFFFPLFLITLLWLKEIFDSRKFSISEHWCINYNNFIDNLMN